MAHPCRGSLAHSGEDYWYIVVRGLTAEQALKAGRIVQLPNGTHFKPTGKKDGSVNIDARVNPDLKKRVNAEFRGKWRNAENIGKSEEDMIALWNEAHPDDLIEE